MLRFAVLGLLVLFAPFSALADKPFAPSSVPGSQVVKAERVVELITGRADLVVIDNRLQSEFEKGHIAGAHNLLDTALTENNLAAVVQNKNTPILFYCYGVRCLRSSNAATQALKWGYKQVYWFRGGWEEWIEKNLPVAR